MTALDRYVRLEALGRWRERQGSPPREVVVSLGKSTLLLRDLEERPLGHWALAGVVLLGRDGTAAIYAMTADGDETLTIDDAVMIEAIAAVVLPRLAIGSRDAPAPRRRPPLAPLLTLAALLAAIALGPRLIRAEAALLLPPERAAEYGDRMLIGLMERDGPPCSDAAGLQALTRLTTRLDPTAPRARVIELGDTPAAVLPGGTLLVDREIARTAPPEAIAGWVALALGRDPVAALVTGAGTAADLHYLMTGDFSEAAMQRATAAVIAPPDPAAAGAALERLAVAGIDPAPFLAALAARGTSPPAPATAAPAAGPALDGPDRVALQAICG